MRNALCGAFFVVALLAAGWQYAVFGLMGTVVSTLTSRVWGVDPARIVAGLEGFNGCLVGVAGAVFLGPEHLSTWLFTIAGAIGAALITSALVTLLATWNIPTLTFPFCVAASVMTVSAPEFERVWHGRPGIAELARPATGATALSWDDLWHAFFANVSQIFFLPQWYVGLLFLIGIFVASRLAGLLASIGSVVGTAAGWALGAPAVEVRSGLLGYNSVLVAMALGVVFIVFTGWSLAYAVLGGAASTGVTGAMGEVFAPVGGHTLTWPFVLTTILFCSPCPPCRG